MENKDDMRGNLNVDIQSQKLPVNEDFKIVPVLSESATINKDFIVTGKVVLDKKIAEREELVKVNLIRDEVITTRIPKDQIIEGDLPKIRYEGDTMIIPVIKEEVVISKRIKLIEEIHIIQKTIIEPHHETILLREEIVSIERS